MKEYIVVFISIFAGAGGCLFTTFWFQPIIRYREIKHQVLSDFIYYANAINVDGLNEIMQNRKEQRVEANRRHSAELRSSYIDLPSWYQKLLTRKDENPFEAATHLMGLSNTIVYDKADKRIGKIKEYLNIYSSFD
jgi:hypothetical protein